MTYSSEVLADSPVMYFRMGEASGNIADSSGGGYTGTITGSPGRVAGLLTGDSNGAIDWDGSSTHCDLPPIGSATVVSAEALIRLDGNNKAQVVHARANESNFDRWYKLVVNASNKVEFWVWRGGAWFTVTGSTTLAIGSIYHLVGADDGSNIRIYVNGSSDATPVAVSGSLGGGNPGGLIAAGYNGSIYARFDGVIDEVAIYHSALSATRIAAHYAASTGPLSPSIPDPVGVSDARTTTLDAPRSVTDAVGATDAATGVIGAVTPASLDDAVGVTDSASATVAGTDYSANPADAVGVTDALDATLSIADSVGIADAVETAVHSLGSVWQPYPVTDTGSQVLDFSIVPTSPEEPWPFVYEGDGYSNSLWLDFTASGTQTLTITLTTSFASGIEVWTGDVDTDPENDLSIEGYGQGTLAVAIAPGQHVYMRAHPLLDTQTTGTGTLTWSVADRPETGVLGFVAAAEVLETPGWIATSLLSAPPSSAVTFALDGGATFFTVTSEEDGTFEGAVELPDLPAGTHTLTATDVDGQTQTVSFTVLLDVPSDGTLPGSAGPATAPSPDPVIHWVLEDPMPGGLGTYTFPINPSEMSSPFPEKQLRPERTVHPSGQDVVWEGRPDPVDWSVKGTVLTEAFYDALTAYHALHRRLYVVDHHQRAWVVAFDNLTFEKKGRPDDWMHTYSAKFLILGGPVSLS